jgi:membrane associated rhomboid family serine protease
MPRIGSTQLAFPDFHGATRLLVVVNLAAYFAFLLAGAANGNIASWIFAHGVLVPQAFLHGWVWEPLTYSLIQVGLRETFFALLSLWFLSGFLEGIHRSNWVLTLYSVSVLGTAATAVLIYLGSELVGYAMPQIPLFGSFGGIFGMLVAIGVLHGDTQFMMFPLPISIKARYLAIVYGLVAVALLFGELRLYAFAQLGGAFVGWLYIRRPPRRGFTFVLSEKWYGLRNRYYRWKRRRAARKFEVYMRSQGRTVRFDGQGRQIDDDHDDKTRWN